jgi:hypothetical protein
MEMVLEVPVVPAVPSVNDERGVEVEAYRILLHLPHSAACQHTQDDTLQEGAKP